ncbi:methyltransferase [Desulfosarcina ovata]|uniref:SAM-dependent methyltransferase n=1 Tax=Desulfosarcina ovata subsp. ovata TaxID=2752305 RepID=A0A5K8AKV3_9BACT|nr:methyltransferase [Desulfosarcina ovata]BBO93228.1 SAM-dependent methyltransferase [Desulfosarcina ovata subsp. ovata]
MDNKHTDDSILKTVRGFMASRVIISAAEIDLFTLLARQSHTADEVAYTTGADLRGITILLDALCALGFMVKTNGTYRTESSAATLLSADAPPSVRPMVLHMGSVWRNWSKLNNIVLGKAVPDLEKGILDKENFEAFIGAMHVVASRAAPDVVAVVNPGGASRLLDVGGGSGSYILAFLDAQPAMRATLFDKPEVIKMARARVEAAGMTDRVTLVVGDFYKDELPTGHDLALLSAIIHQNSPAENEELYCKIHRALDGGGRIVIRDHVMSPDHTQPLEGALFAVNMLAGTKGGGTYTFQEIEAGLAAAGFTKIKQLQDKRMFSLVEGYKA